MELARYEKNPEKYPFKPATIYLNNRKEKFEFASKKLNSMGIKGIKYNGRQDGECYVVFDDKSVQILNTFYQEEQQSLFEGNNKARDIRKIKGSYMPAEKIIELFKNADESTIIHEYAHWYLSLISRRNYMNTSKKGKALIKKYEGCRLKAYKCPAGVLTIGYGHTNNVRLDDVLTQDEAEKLLDIDIKIKEKELNKLIKVPVTQNQYDALISFAFNLGVGNLKASTLLRLLNQKNYKGAAQQFDRWVYAGNKVLAGLVKRRAEEKELFLS